MLRRRADSAAQCLRCGKSDAWPIVPIIEKSITSCSAAGWLQTPQRRAYTSHARRTMSLHARTPATCAPAIAQACALSRTGNSTRSRPIARRQRPAPVGVQRAVGNSSMLRLRALWPVRARCDAAIHARLYERTYLAGRGLQPDRVQHVANAECVVPTRLHACRVV